MALVKWNRPELKVSEEATGRRRKLDRISWRDVLDAVGRVEMELRRLHTSEHLSSGHPLIGSVRVQFLRDRETTQLLAVYPDPGVDTIGPRVADIVVGAPFKPSPTAMVVDIVCTFAAENTGGGWDPGGGDDDFGSGGRTSRDFGDPF